MTIESLRADIVEVGRRMYARGYTASNDGNISVRVGDNRLLMTPKSVCKGFMTPDMMCVTDLAGKKIQGDRDPSSEMLMHLEVYRQRPDVKAVVLANHGALTVGGDLFSAYYKMETIEHFAKISLVARMLGGENLISREEVMRLQELRGTYGIKAPAPICLDSDVPVAPGQSAQVVVTADDATCQTVQAPAGTGSRLVPDLIDAHRRASGEGRQVAGDETEIRLTYRELSALIEDAIKSLR